MIQCKWIFDGVFVGMNTTAVGPQWAFLWISTTEKAFLLGRFRIDQRPGRGGIKHGHYEHSAQYFDITHVVLGPFNVPVVVRTLSRYLHQITIVGNKHVRFPWRLAT